MNKSFDPDQPIVLIDATTGQRQLIWAELDSNATSPEETDLLIRVGKNLKDGHRYIVAMRNLKDRRRQTIPAPPGSSSTATDPTTEIPAIESRRHHFEHDLHDARQDAGIERGNLYVAWDFTVASTAEHDRADALDPRRRLRRARRHTTWPTASSQGARAGVHDHRRQDRRRASPTGIVDLAVRPDHGVENIREVTGTFKVPCYLNQTAAARRAPVQARRQRRAGADRATSTRALHLQHPALGGHDDPAGDVSRQRRSGRRCTGTGCSATTPRSTPANVRTARHRPRRDDLRDRLHRHVRGRRRPESRSRRCSTCRTSRRCPTASSRASSTSSTWAGCMIHPDGFASDPAFQFNGAVGHRHEQAALLLRQQPGRDRRRRADRASRPTSPARSSTCRG